MPEIVFTVLLALVYLDAARSRSLIGMLLFAVASMTSIILPYLLHREPPPGP